MSTLCAPVVRLGKIGKNPNSDTLAIWNGPQGPVQFKIGQFKEGDLAVFVPADTMVPLARNAFSFLVGPGDTVSADSMRRLRPIKLRGIPSVGLLLEVPTDSDGPWFSVGDDASEWFGLKKYEPPQTHSFFTNSSQAPTPEACKCLPVYDIENCWLFDALVLSTDIGSGVRPDQKEGAPALDVYGNWHISEKIHGCNWRAYRDPEGKIHVGSRNRWVVPEDGNVWSEAFKRQEAILNKLFDAMPDTVIFGEAYGKVQDLHYGEAKVNLRLFDSFDLGSCSFNPISKLATALTNIEGGLAIMVPHLDLFHGTLRDAIERGHEHAQNARSNLDPMTIREGVVIRPVGEEILLTGKQMTRCITKVINKAYLERENGTEEH